MNDLELGIQAHRAGQWEAARNHYLGFLKQNPKNPDALHLLADALRRLRLYAPARTAIMEALEHCPMSFECHRTFGHILLDQNLQGLASISYMNALNINPDDVASLLNLAIIRIGFGQYDEAVRLCEKALTLSPNNPVAHANHGAALMGLRKFDQAIASYGNALAINSNIPIAYYSLACCHKEMGEVSQAIDLYLKTLSLIPNHRESLDCLMHLLLFQPVFNYALFNQVAENCRRLLPAPNPPEKTPILNRPIRVGFVSADLHDHPVGRFLAALLPNLDHSEFFTIIYSDSNQDDDIQKSIRSSCALWRFARPLNDLALDAKIRDDRVDLLIDLSLHTSGNRLTVFARKPAPTQATWLGYCSTTALPAIDYRLTDPILDPPDATDPIYTEKSIRLPDAWWCYPQPPFHVELSEKPKTPVFGCLNAVSKINDAVLDAWIQILLQTPDSTIFIHAELEPTRKHILNKLESGQIHPGRIFFVGRQCRRDYFQTFNRMNIALDPFPHNGGTTTCDALFMGVPVVSFKGDRAMARMGASILHAASLPELCGDSVQDYIRIAVDLAMNNERRNELNLSLRERVINSPLMNAKAFAANFADAIRQMTR